MNKQMAEILYSLIQRPEWKTYMEYKLTKLNDCHLELEYRKKPAMIQGKIAEIREDLELKNTLDAYLK